MPIAIHESLKVSIVHEIRRQVDVIREGNNSAAILARDIVFNGSASILLEDGARRDPDTQFGYWGTQYPTLVVEIAYSQRIKHLPRLADHYIVESSGRIQMVIGIKLDYRGSKTATVSVWCPLYGSDSEGRFLASEQILSEVCEIKDLYIYRADLKRSFGEQMAPASQIKRFEFS